jgi:hypothetical protein
MLSDGRWPSGTGLKDNGGPLRTHARRAGAGARSTGRDTLKVPQRRRDRSQSAACEPMLRGAREPTVSIFSSESRTGALRRPRCRYETGSRSRRCSPRHLPFSVGVTVASALFGRATCPGDPRGPSSTRSSAITSRPFSPEPASAITPCLASSSASFAPISIVAPWRAASCVSTAMPAAATASSPSRARAASAPPALDGAWPILPRISSTASSPRSPCASGCSVCRLPSATAWRTTPVSRARS